MGMDGVEVQNRQICNHGDSPNVDHTEFSRTPIVVLVSEEHTLEE